MNTVTSNRILQRVRAYGLLVLAALLPGGLLVALVVWLHGHKRKGDAA